MMRTVLRVTTQPRCTAFPSRLITCRQVKGKHYVANGLCGCQGLIQQMVLEKRRTDQFRRNASSGTQ
jgi:hypothetical protein